MNGKQPLFIFGCPRSGTTLVQRILNSYEDVCIWGEHYGFLKPLADSFFRIWDQENFFEQNRRWRTKRFEGECGPASFYLRLNPMEREKWRQDVRNFLISIFVPPDIAEISYWGFKEISYPANSNDRTLEFLSLMFPEAIFVFVIRNAFNVIASWQNAGWHRESFLDSFELMTGRWKFQNKTYSEWHRTQTIRSFYLRYEEFIEGKGDLLGLLSRMGKQFGERQCAMLQTSHGRGSSFPGDPDPHRRWKVFSRPWLSAIEAAVGKQNHGLGYEGPRLSRGWRWAGLGVLFGIVFYQKSKRFLRRLIHYLVPSDVRVREPR